MGSMWSGRHGGALTTDKYAILSLLVGIGRTLNRILDPDDDQRLDSVPIALKWTASFAATWRAVSGRRAKSASMASAWPSPASA